MILSPLSNKPAILEKEFSKKSIEEAFEKTMNINVAHLLSSARKVKLFKCPTTGYRFYYPYSISGDSKFYEQLQKFEWYYMPWKWEHEFCKKIIDKNSKVLEVGCAKGDFLRKIREEIGVEVVGLELNKKAIMEGKKNGLPIVDETIQNHAIGNKGKYDVVCSFQVLEHISDVSSFLQAQIDCIRENGRLVIAVPNNDSFIKYDEGNMLNNPPHHMGLWNPSSIKSLEKVFNIKFTGIYFEPLQEVHFQWFYYVQIRRLHAKNEIIGKAIERLTKPFYKLFLRLTKGYIKGHTMLAVFQK